MRLVAAALILMLVSSSVSASVQIAGLYGTGVNDSGVPLADGALDTHYSIVSSTASSFPVGPGGSTPLTYADLSSLYAVYPGSWVANSSTSQWIGPTVPLMSPTSTGWDGNFLYEIEFDLTGLDPASAEITGTWASDNGSEILINGAPTIYTKGETGYSALDSFTIDFGFLPGINKLQFLVNNASLSGGRPNPTGLRVDGLEGTANAVPEPLSCLVWGALALCSLAVAARDRR